MLSEETVSGRHEMYGSEGETHDVFFEGKGDAVDYRLRQTRTPHMRSL